MCVVCVLSLKFQPSEAVTLQTIAAGIHISNEKHPFESSRARLFIYTKCGEDWSSSGHGRHRTDSPRKTKVQGALPRHLRRPPSGRSLQLYPSWKGSFQTAIPRLEWFASVFQIYQIQSISSSSQWIQELQYSHGIMLFLHRLYFLIHLPSLLPKFFKTSHIQLCLAHGILLDLLKVPSKKIENEETTKENTVYSPILVDSLIDSIDSPKTWWIPHGDPAWIPQPVLVLREGVEVDAACVVHPSQPQHQLQGCHPMDGGEGQAVLRTQPRMTIVPWDLGGCYQCYHSGGRWCYKKWPKMTKNAVKITENDGKYGCVRSAVKLHTSSRNKKKINDFKKGDFFSINQPWSYHVIRSLKITSGSAGFRDIGGPNLLEQTLAIWSRVASECRTIFQPHLPLQDLNLSRRLTTGPQGGYVTVMSRLPSGKLT